MDWFFCQALGSTFLCDELYHDLSDPGSHGEAGDEFDALADELLVPAITAFTPISE